MKSVRLTLFLLLGLCAQPMYAGAADSAKKAVKICWNASQLLAGGAAFIVLFQADVKEDKLAGVVMFILGLTAVSAGIKGLDHELHVSYDIKNLIKRIRRRH